MMGIFCGSLRMPPQCSAKLHSLRMILVKLQRRHRDMVKNGQKLKKGSFLLKKTLTLEMAPNDMIQETRKKN